MGIIINILLLLVVCIYIALKKLKPVDNPKITTFDINAWSNNNNNNYRELY